MPENKVPTRLEDVGVAKPPEVATPDIMAYLENYIPDEVITELSARFPRFRIPRAPKPKPGDEKLPPWSTHVVVPSLGKITFDEVKEFAKSSKKEFDDFMDYIKYKISNPFEDIINDAINWQLTKNRKE